MDCNSIMEKKQKQNLVCQYFQISPPRNGANVDMKQEKISEVS